MLRLTVLILILANASYFAWAQGYLQPWGLGPVQQAEPQRLAQQVRPKSLRVLQGDEARQVIEAAAAARAPECLASPPLPDAVAAAVRKELTQWPVGTWGLEPAVEPGRWIIYMGKYASQEMLEKKKSELRARGVSFEPLGNPSLEPGLSLGGFPTQAEANEQLSTLGARGVRTARVVQERPELRGPALRLPAVDDALRGRLDELRAALAGQPLRPCR